MSNVSDNLFTNSSTCNNVVFTDYNVVIASICSTLALFGIVYTYFGYRCFKAVMFLSGLIFGGTTVYSLCREERIFQETVSMEVAAGISIGIGVLSGFITMLVRYVGLFLQGFYLGILLAFAGKIFVILVCLILPLPAMLAFIDPDCSKPYKNVFPVKVTLGMGTGIIALQSFYHPSTPWIPGAILFCTGILCSLLTLKFQKRFVIISTAVYGSILITACVDYFLEHFLLMRYAWDALMAASPITLCWYSWIVLAIWPFLSITGTILQWKVTAKGYDHTDVIIPRGARKHVRTHLVRPQRSQQSGSRPQDSGAVVSDHNRRRSREQQPTSAPSRSTRQRQRTARPNPPAQRQAIPVDDAPPPSYFECVELGVGEPVRRSNNSPRSQPASNATHSSMDPPQTTESNDLVRQLVSGQGYAISSGPAPVSQGYVANVDARSARAERRSGNPAPTHVPIEQFARRPKVKSSRSKNNPSDPRRKLGGAKPYQVSPSSEVPSSRRGSRSDTQRLLPHSNRPLSSRDALSAHAQRVLAVQSRRAPGQVQTTTQSSAQPFL